MFTLGLFTHLLAGLVGFGICGVIANRRPQWFATIVKAANAVDSAANTAVAKAKAPSTPPA